jgi:hypothetical protein
MGRKLYEKQAGGGIKFTSHRMGQVRVPNFVYDIWLPILGAKGVAVYSVYCRLERESVVKAITQADIARACRIGTNTLAAVNDQLEECGFIKITRPEGHKRLMHWTVEIEVCDAPTDVSAEIMAKYAHPQGYEALSTWLVAPEIPDSISENSDQHLDEIPNGMSNVASLGLHPLEVEKEHGADAPTPVLEQPQTEEQQPEGEELLNQFLGEREHQPELKETPPWTQTAMEEWTVWGHESAEFQEQLSQYGSDGRTVQKLGYALEKLTGLHPLWSDKSAIKSWCSGLWTCVQEAGGDPELVLRAARELITSEMTVSDPWSLRKKSRALAAKHKVSTKIPEYTV